jgi:hypothetical protein
MEEAMSAIDELRELGLLPEKEAHDYHRCEYRGGCDCADRYLEALAAVAVEWIGLRHVSEHLRVQENARADAAEIDYGQQESLARHWMTEAEDWKAGHDQACQSAINFHDEWMAEKARADTIYREFLLKCDELGVAAKV